MPMKSSAAIAFDDGLELLFGEIANRQIERNAFGAGVTLQIDQILAVARLVPGIDGAFGERFAFVGDHAIDVEIDGVAEALAARAGAVGIVEREKARLGFLIDDAAGFAFEALAEGEALGGLRGGVFAGGEFQDGFAAAFAVADFDGVHQARADRGIESQTIHDDVDGLREIQIEQRFRRREFVGAAGLIEAIEAALLQAAREFL